MPKKLIDASQFYAETISHGTPDHFPPPPPLAAPRSSARGRSPLKAITP
jgi:hypothetical protein